MERSLPFIDAEGQRWIEEKKCVTCHQVPFMVWSLNAAADRGLVLDRQKLAECSQWALDWTHMATKEDLPKGEEHTLGAPQRSGDSTVTGTIDAQRRPDAGVGGALCQATRRGSTRRRLVARRRPAPWTKATRAQPREVSTMWALVALQSTATADASLPGRLEKAHRWLGSQTEAKSTEWWAVRMLQARACGNADEANRLRGELLKWQHADGGWGWLTDDDSDAFGAGIALYALTRDGLSSTDAAIARARQWLIQTQQPDGSWPVKGTKKVKANQIEPTATYWGTCWAVIGLCETLPRAAANSP